MHFVRSREKINVGEPLPILQNFFSFLNEWEKKNQSQQELMKNFLKSHLEETKPPPKTYTIQDLKVISSSEINSLLLRDLHAILTTLGVSFDRKEKKIELKKKVRQLLEFGEKHVPFSLSKIQKQPPNHLRKFLADQNEGYDDLTKEQLLQKALSLIATQKVELGKQPDASTSSQYVQFKKILKKCQSGIFGRFGHLLLHDIQACLKGIILLSKRISFVPRAIGTDPLESHFSILRSNVGAGKLDALQHNSAERMSHLIDMIASAKNLQYPLESHRNVAMEILKSPTKPKQKKKVRESIVLALEYRNGKHFDSPELLPLRFGEIKKFEYIAGYLLHKFKTTKIKEVTNHSLFQSKILGFIEEEKERRLRSKSTFATFTQQCFQVLITKTGRGDQGKQFVSDAGKDFLDILCAHLEQHSWLFQQFIEVYYPEKRENSAKRQRTLRNHKNRAPMISLTAGESQDCLLIFKKLVRKCVFVYAADRIKVFEQDVDKREECFRTELKRFAKEHVKVKDGEKAPKQ